MSHTEGMLRRQENILFNSKNNPVCLVSSSLNVADAEHLVKCWNEHDGLVEKAERYDELKLLAKTACDGCSALQAIGQQETEECKNCVLGKIAKLK